MASEDPTRADSAAGNGDEEGDADARADAADRELARRRGRVLAGSYRLFYRAPVHLVRGRGQYVWDAEGREYLDAYNNVPSIGHAHPAVTRAVADQLARINTNTRYLDDHVVDYAQDLVSTLPGAGWRAVFTCTGSEANDLAIRAAQAYTGGRGLIVTRRAYHGTSYLTAGVSPALGHGQELLPEVRLVDPPDAYRVRVPDLGRWFAAQVQAQIDDLRAHGIRLCAFLADSIFSSDGILADPRGFLRPVADVVHRAGGVYIADEVEPGFARTGDAFWAFGLHGIVPDAVTVGKAMANGIPAAGLLARPELMDAFAAHHPYFNTFGGNPVAMAAAQAVLRVIREERLQEHARAVGGALRRELRGLAGDHPSIGDVRGAGLYIGVELVGGRDGGTPDPGLAAAVTEGLRHRRVLLSVAGPRANVLKIRPPLPFDEGDVDRLVSSLDQTLAALGR